MDVSYKEKWESLKLTVRWMYKSSKFLMLLIVFLVVVGGLLVIIEPYIFKIVIDMLVDEKQTSLVQSLGIGVVGVIVIFAVSKGISNIFWDFTDVIRRYHNFMIDRYITERVMHKVADLDIAYFEDPEYYNTFYQASVNSWRILDVFWQFTFLIRQAVSIAVVIGAIFLFDWKIVALIFVAAVPAIILTLKFGNVSWGIFAASSPVARHANYYRSLLTDRLDAIKEIKIFKLKGHFIKKFRVLIDEYIGKYSRVVKKELLMQSGLGILEAVISGLVAWIVVVHYMNGNITIGELTFYWALLFEFSALARWSVRGIAIMNLHLTFLTPFTKIMSFPSRIVSPENPVQFPKRITKGIEFRNVTFYYPGSKKPVLENFNMKIKSNESIAIVGENGSGKTTLMKLLCRLYDVDDGEILVDGINIKNFSLDDLYDNIGIIFQDFTQYEAMVEENIGFGRLEYLKDKDKIHNSAMKSGAWEFIKDLDKKYETMLGKRLTDDGTDLSVGQWQKVALARAFFRDANIMILDEPTAAVDAKAEYQLFQKFEHLTKNKTTLLISHRFSTVRMADRIIVMDKGKIIETGSHKQLLKKNGTYAHLFKLQAKGYK